jgi:hypothetical protein
MMFFYIFRIKIISKFNINQNYFHALKITLQLDSRLFKFDLNVPINLEIVYNIASFH